MRAITPGTTSTGCGTCFIATLLNSVCISAESENRAESGRMHNVQQNDAAHLKSEEKLRVLLVSIVPPRNDCGVRIVMHRQVGGAFPV